LVRFWALVPVFALRIQEGIPRRFLDRVLYCQGEYSSRSVVSSDRFAIYDMDGSQIFESILGPINTQRMQKARLDSIFDLEGLSANVVRFEIEKTNPRNLTQ
jgi:hypothetical protein